MWKVCAFFTTNTAYESHSKKFIESVEQFSLPYDVVPIENKGSWYANTQYKPTFLKKMLEKHFPESVVYVDIDAIFCRYPGYFDKLEATPEVNIAVHVLDHSKYRRKNHPPEMLSGTIFLKNTIITNEVVNKWILECKKDPKLWDQQALATVLKKHKYHLLPEEYCTIFDYMSSVKNPAIKHFQASRESRRGNVEKKQSVVLPRRVVKNGNVHKIRRIR